jgi:aspartyl-tRNA(Asn)/glutamyl-tRNA(Gln) amidotransferase subunit B
VRKAIDYEVARQIEVIEGGGRIVQETRLWNSDEERTVSMRSKEEAHDYRYFPDPDLPLLALDAQWLEDVRKAMPELPAAQRARFVRDYALSEYDAGVLTATRALADFFERTAAICKQPKAAANWIMGDVLRACKEDGIDLKDLSRSKVTPQTLADMILLVEKGAISGKMAKTVMEEMIRTGQTPAAIVEARGMSQISNDAEIEKIVDAVLDANPEPAAAYRAGKQALFGFFVGQTMKATGGRANPQRVNELLRKKLAG